MGQEYYQELLGVDMGTAVRFFYNGLTEVAGQKPKDQMEYVASVLAHFSLTPRSDLADAWSGVGDMREVLERFSLVYQEDSKMMEIGGSQLLFIAGFFRGALSNQVYKLGWCDHQGSLFYKRASELAEREKRRILLERMSQTFPDWTAICSDLNRYFQACRCDYNFR